MWLRFKELTARNFKKYKRCVWWSELTYPSKIRSKNIAYVELLSAHNAIGLVAKRGLKYVGNIIGAPLEPGDKKRFNITARVSADKIIYVYNVVIDDEFRGKGYGYRLVGQFIKVAKRKGYERLVGHFRRNGSVQLIQKFGAKVKRTCWNWQDTKETFCFCELKL